MEADFGSLTATRLLGREWVFVMAAVELQWHAPECARARARGRLAAKRLDAKSRWQHPLCDNSSLIADHVLGARQKSFVAKRQRF